MTFLTIERKLSHDYKINTSHFQRAHLAFLFLSLNGAGKAITTHYVWIMLPLPSGKEVNAFVHKNKVSQSFWKAQFLLGSFVLAQFFVLATALLLRTDCPPSEERMAVSFCKCLQSVTAVCCTSLTLLKQSKAGLQSHSTALEYSVIPLDPAKLCKPWKARLRNASLQVMITTWSLGMCCIRDGPLMESELQIAFLRRKLIHKGLDTQHKLS